MWANDVKSFVIRDADCSVECGQWMGQSMLSLFSQSVGLKKKLIPISGSQTVKLFCSLPGVNGFYIIDHCLLLSDRQQW